MSLINAEVTQGENYNENVREDYKKYSNRIKRANPKKIKKDVNIDMISKIVENRISGQNNLQNTKETGSSYLDIVLKIGGLLIMIVIAYASFEGYKSQKKAQEEMIKKQSMMQRNESDVIKVEEFGFESSSKYYHINYFGKDGIMADVIAHITNILEIINSNDLHKIEYLKSPQKNFLLSGKPGTGKTLFVQKIAGLLDLNLKSIQMKKEVGKDKINEMTNKEIMDYLNKIPSKVRIAFLTPSIINDKYMGEAEKRVRALFTEASNPSGYEATILFFDEMDAFFCNRDTKGNENFLKIQTELLAWINGVKDQIKRTVFLFGATNRIDMLDGAFNRRFANKIEFKKPDLKEVMLLLESLTVSWGKPENEDIKNEICKLIVEHEMYQSRIVEEITSVYIFMRKKHMDKWNFLLEKLKEYNQHSSAQNVTTTLNNYGKDADSLFVFKKMFRGKINGNHRSG